MRRCFNDSYFNCNTYMAGVKMLFAMYCWEAGLEHAVVSYFEVHSLQLARSEQL